ncbi:hypothetical protein FRC15_007884 [Serendipita sp. 397]|nr:hypothetical protein FRC15_007884 [Serendipita sp. 397]
MKTYTFRSLRMRCLPDVGYYPMVATLMTRVCVPLHLRSLMKPSLDEIEPDYQFDVYRMMRHHNNDEWSDFHPLSNVMWLHYLATKLLNHKGLKRPSLQARTTSTEGRKRVSLSENHLESEWSAYQHLKNSEVRLELRLKEVIDGMQGRTSPRKAKPGPVRKQPLHSRKTGETHKSTGSTVQLESASDVVAMWLTKGW